MKFESIQGPITDFQVVLSGLAEIWSDAASFDARELLRDMLDASRLLPKAEKEIDRLETVSARYRNEQNATRTQLKTTEAELSRLRQAANDTLDSNARLLTEIDQLRTTDAVFFFLFLIESVYSHYEHTMYTTQAHYEHTMYTTQAHRVAMR